MLVESTIRLDDGIDIIRNETISRLVVEYKWIDCIKICIVEIDELVIYNFPAITVKIYSSIKCVKAIEQDQKS